MTMDIIARLTPVFREVFDDDGISPHPGMVAKDVDGWDSLTHIRLIVSIEKAFQVRFSAGEIGSLKNVGDLAALLEAKLARTSPPA
jgi:acyl carrier protein